LTAKELYLSNKQAAVEELQKKTQEMTTPVGELKEQLAKFKP